MAKTKKMPFDLFALFDDIIGVYDCNWYENNYTITEDVLQAMMKLADEEECKYGADFEEEDIKELTDFLRKNLMGYTYKDKMKMEAPNDYAAGHYVGKFKSPKGEVTKFDFHPFPAGGIMIHPTI